MTPTLVVILAAAFGYLPLFWLDRVCLTGNRANAATVAQIVIYGLLFGTAFGATWYGVRAVLGVVLGIFVYFVQSTLTKTN